MALVHTHPEFIQFFELGLSKVHDDTAKRLPRDYRDWLREEPAKRLFDTESGTSGLGPMPEKEVGGLIELDKIFQADPKTFTLKFYAIGVAIQYEALRWDLYDVFPKLMKSLAKSAVATYNLVAYSILAESFSPTESTYQTHQGEPLFTDSHTRLDGGTWSNAGAVGLSTLGFKEARIELRRTVDERGVFLADVNPTLVLTSPEQEMMAEIVLESTLRPGTADNDKNPYKGKGYNVKVSPYITLTTAWWLWDKNVEISMRLGDEPFMHFDGEIRSMNRIGTAYCSFGVRAWDSKGAWASTGGA